MKKVKFYIGTGNARAIIEEEFEFEDNTTNKEIEQEYNEWVWSGIVDLGWYEIEENKKCLKK